MRWQRCSTTWCALSLPLGASPRLEAAMGKELSDIIKMLEEAGPEVVGLVIPHFFLRECREGEEGDQRLHRVHCAVAPLGPKWCQHVLLGNPNEKLWQSIHVNRLAIGAAAKVGRWAGNAAGEGGTEGARRQ